MKGQVTKEESKQMALEMFIGCDRLFDKHMHSIDDLFTQCRAIQGQREILLHEMATLAQIFRDLQLKNVFLMENIDD